MLGIAVLRFVVPALARCILAAGLVLLLSSLTGCGSGFVKGWRDDSQDPIGSPEERCERIEGHSFVNGACQADDGIALTTVTSSVDCERLEHHGWFDGQCLAYNALNEVQCGQISHVGVWEWFQGACVLRLQAECERDPNKMYRRGRCLDRPVPRKSPA